MDEGGGVEGLAGPLASELPRREPAQLVVDQRQELIGRLRLAAFDV